MFEDERCEVMGGRRVFDAVDVIGLFMTCTRLVSSVCAGAEARQRVRSATSSGGTLMTRRVGDNVPGPGVERRAGPLGDVGVRSQHVNGALGQKFR